MDKTPVTAFIEWAGSRQRAAEELGVSISLVNHMANGIRQVSVPVAKRINELTGQPLSQLRPDIWN